MSQATVAVVAGAGGALGHATTEALAPADSRWWRLTGTSAR